MSDSAVKNFVPDQVYIEAIKKYIEDPAQNELILQNGKSKFLITTNPDAEGIIPMNAFTFKGVEYHFGIRL